MTSQSPGWAMSVIALVGWAVTCVVAGVVATRMVAIALALAGTVAWAGLLVWQRARRRRRDRDAHERLQLLRDRTCEPGVRLLAVIGTDWANGAGQAAVTVEVNTGAAGTEWFPLAMLPHGSMVLVTSEAGAPRLLDWMSPGEVQAAHRHRQGEAGGGSSVNRSRSWRRQRSLIAEIETALRQHGDATTPGIALRAHRVECDSDRWKETP